MSRRYPKSGKKLIIVEGKSDEIFIKGLLRYLNLTRLFDVKLSGDENHCDILNKKEIEKLLLDAQKDGYDEVYILIDLNTDCRDYNPSCVVELRDWYHRNVINSEFHQFVKVIVAINELECWELLGWIAQNQHTNSNCIRVLNQKIDPNKKLSKIKMAQSAVRKIRKILENCNLNPSFKYFLQKIGYSC